METLKIRVKVGEHEFEAEGPRESVELQLQMFKELVGATPSKTADKGTDRKPPLSTKEPLDGTGEEIPPDKSTYSALFSLEGDKLSLNYLPEGENREANALLLLLFGCRVTLGQETVLGGRLMQGLQQSGLTLDRIDRVLGPYIPSLVITTGIKRGTKYRLTNVGVTRAKTLAEEQLKVLG